MFHLDGDALTEIRRTLADRVQAGLRAEDQQIRGLPAHLPPPPPNLSGEALVVDIGGTNVRAARVKVTPEAGPQVIAGPIEQRLPMRSPGTEPMTKDALFSLQADLATRLDPPKNLPVGYCFSYPSEVLPSRDARLIRWTKGIDVPDVEGRLVGKALGEALHAAGLAPTEVRVLNDTVASLLAGTLGFPQAPRNTIGLIVGTGTNMAGFYDADQAPKLTGLPTPMAINFESGNFHPPHLSEADDAVDAASDNPGAQRFEKAVSGFYLPFVFQQAGDVKDFDPHAGSGALVDLRNQGHPVAAAILDRSADLVAAGLAGVIDTYTHDDGDVGILAEGGLFWRAPGYADRVKTTLTTLLDGKRKFDILRQQDANLLGSACAALV